MPQVITSAVQKAIFCPHIDTHTQKITHLQKPIFPLPHAMASAEDHINAG